MDKISLWINVCADDCTAERATSASNNDGTLLKKGIKVKRKYFFVTERIKETKYCYVKFLRKSFNTEDTLKYLLEDPMLPNINELSPANGVFWVVSVCHSVRRWVPVQGPGISPLYRAFAPASPVQGPGPSPSPPRHVQTCSSWPSLYMATHSNLVTMKHCVGKRAVSIRLKCLLFYLIIKFLCRYCKDLTYDKEILERLALFVIDPMLAR